MYFSGSCFYDPTRSSNERVGGRVQELVNMTGIEYVGVELAHPGPELMAVERRIRSGPHQTDTEAAYYMLDGTIYQCPDLHALLHSRLVGAWVGATSQYSSPPFFFFLFSPEEGGRSPADRHEAAV